MCSIMLKNIGTVHFVRENEISVTKKRGFLVGRTPYYPKFSKQEKAP
jgi:hypothetical protein